MLTDGGEITQLANILQGRQDVPVCIFCGATALIARLRAVIVRIKHKIAACAHAVGDKKMQFLL
jgi:hypothetical protein